MNEIKFNGSKIKPNYYSDLVYQTTNNEKPFRKTAYVTYIRHPNPCSAFKEQIKDPRTLPVGGYPEGVRICTFVSFYQNMHHFLMGW